MILLNRPALDQPVGQRLCDDTRFWRPARYQLRRSNHGWFPGPSRPHQVPEAHTGSDLERSSMCRTDSHPQGKGRLGDRRIPPGCCSGGIGW